MECGYIQCSSPPISLDLTLLKSIQLYIIQQTLVMIENLDVTKAPPVMRHIISELLELTRLDLRSQQASAAQGYNLLCSECAAPL